MKKQFVHIIGDMHRDQLNVHDKNGNLLQPVLQYGGTLFVKQIISGIGKNLENESIKLEAITYHKDQGLQDELLGSLYDAVWRVKLFKKNDNDIFHEDDAYRCVNRIEEVEFRKEENSLQHIYYEKSKFEKNIVSMDTHQPNTKSYFMMECIGNHAGIKDGSGYVSFFNNKQIMKQLIFEAESLKSNNKAPCYF